MRILVCDRDEKTREDLEKKLIDLYSEHAEEDSIVVATFKSIFELEDYIEKKRLIVDAVFMNTCDEKGNSKSGLNMAKKVKNTYPDVQLVLYGDNTECVEEAFEVNPLWLLLNPTIGEKLDKVMQRLIEVTSKEKYITVKKINGIRRINEKDIYYIESKGKYLHIHMKDECVTTISKMEDFVKKLGEEFIRCHQSYVVNSRKVKECDYANITLLNGEQINISRSYRASVKEMFLKCAE